MNSNSQTKRVISRERGRGMRLSCITLSVQIIVYVILALTTPRLVHAAVFNCSSGDVDCLIDAINTANTNGEDDTINLADGTYTLTAVDNNTDGANGLPSITSNITINGFSLNSSGAITTTIRRSTLRGTPAFRILYVAPTGTLRLDRLIIRDGITGDDGIIAGGGILNRGKVTLINSAVRNNKSVLVDIDNPSQGGGIMNLGTMSIMSIINSTVSNNKTECGSGGGINNPGGTLTVNNSTISNNSAVDTPNCFGARGGGISTGATLTVTNSTISGNMASQGGGGILHTGGTTTLKNVTITNNIVPPNGSIPSGGGISGLGQGVIKLKNTIIAGNIDADNSKYSDCDVPLTSQGYNLIGINGCEFVSSTGDQVGTEDNPIDPMLGPLQDNCGGNGCTATHALLLGSLAVDAGTNSGCPSTDQRNFVRPAVGSRGGTLTCDIGAFERLAKPACGRLAAAATIVGTSGNDTLNGTANVDRIHGLGGNDTISGLEGNDSICGGPGDDTLFGGNDNDNMFGDDGNDTFNGGFGTDAMSGGIGNDNLFGSADDDSLFGGRDDDTLNGGGGTDNCNGGDHINGDTADPSCETVTNVP